MSSAATQFLQTIVPNQDLLCIAHSREIPAKGRRTQPWTQTFFTPEQAANGKLIDHLSELNKHHDTNVYFSVATFKVRKREQANVTKLKCILLDIDLKGDRPHYKTKSDAVIGLLRLWKEVTCLPKPWIIDSGNGIHAYFVFEKGVSMKEWYVVANTFAKVAEHVDPRLLADPKPTKDAARVMRVPNSWNAKQAKRGHVKVLGKGEAGKFAEIKAGLASEATARNVWVKDVVPSDTPLIDKPAPTHAVATASSLGGGFTDNEITFSGLSPRPIMVGCKQMHRMMKLRGNVSEPEWLLMMRVLNTCDKAEQLVHTFSNGHPGYSKAETDRKLRHVRNNFGAPSATCDEFRSCNPKHCRGCKFRDKVWTPSQLGLFEQQQELHEEQKATASKELMEGKKTEHGFLPMPVSYHQTRHSESHAPVTMIPVWQGEEEGIKNKPIIKGHINIIGSSEMIETNMRGQTNVSDLMIHLNVHVWNRQRNLAIPATVLLDTLAKAKAPFHDVGLVFKTNGFKENNALTEFFCEIVQVANHRPVPYYDTKGWTTDGLTLGAVKLLANKRPVEGYTHGQHIRRNDNATEKFCSGRPVGMEGKWKQALSVFDGDYPHAHIVLLSGIANLLLPLSAGIQGGIVIALTGESGKGKTTLMHFMNSFLGHPTEGIVQGTSTDLVMLEMLKHSSCFMLPVDDLTSMTAKNLGMMMSTVTSGRPRQRMEQPSGGKWNASDAPDIHASIMLTSNFSTSAAFMSSKASSEQLQLEAAMTRQLEIPAYETYISGVEDSRWNRAKSAIRTNYGHALRPFGQYLVDNRALLSQVMENEQNAFSKELKQRLGGQVSGQYRYWVRYLAAIKITAEILTDLGLIKWDVNNIVATGIQLAVNQQGHTEQVQESDMDTLWDMLTNDDQGRTNINLSEMSAEDTGQYPRWDDEDGNRSRGQHRDFAKHANNHLFQQITNRVVNAPQWRIIATEVYVNGKLDRLERQVQIPITKLRGLLRYNDMLSASVWEELYGSLVKAGAKVIGVLPSTPNRIVYRRFNISAVENNPGNATNGVEIIFPPIKF